MSRRVLSLQVNKDAFEKKYKEIESKLGLSESKSKVYFDTNIFSRAVDGNIKAPEASALRRVMTKNAIELYTSEKTRKELANHPKKAAQDYLQFIVNLVNVIAEENFIKVYSGAIGSAPLGTRPLGSGATVEDPMFAQLSEIFDQDDAEQVFQAIKSNAEYFLTLDERTILSKRKEYNKLGFSTKIVSPENLEKILFAIDDNTA